MATKGKYAPESFIIPGQDTNGNSIREWCRVIPLLDRSIDVIVASRRFPFRTKGDLMRWCLKFGVDHLEKLEPVSGSVTAQVDAMLSVLRDEELNHGFLTVFNTMAHTIGLHIQAQALGEARRVISEMRHMILKVENAYWRKRYLDELDSKFGHLLKGGLAPSAGMDSFGDHGPDKSGVDEEDQE